MRTTCVATLLSGGHAENALPQTATANINCRILPNEDPEMIKATLIKVIDNSQVAVSAVRMANPSPASPINPDLFKKIEVVTQQLFPDVPVVPVMSTGATDGRYLRTANIPTYGVSGIFGDVNDPRAHGKDERIKVKSFYDGQEFLYRLVKELSAKTSIKRDY
jgi:acetylornithine deacetylase/succinyl-diaminopimelate desuccinylase-like protein